MRLQRCAVAAVLVAACGESSSPGGRPGSGPGDGGTARADGSDSGGGAGDTGGRDAGTLDAAARDASPPIDAGPFACDPLARPADPEAFAAISGRIAVWDYVVFDERTNTRGRWRNFSFNFRGMELPPFSSGDAMLFRGIPVDQCITLDVPVPRTNLGPAIDVGVSLDLTPGAGGAGIRLFRRLENGEPQYRPLGSDAVFLRDFPFDAPWNWSTPGDADAPLATRPASALVAGVEDFEVMPAFSSTTAPAILSTRGTTISWSPPTTASQGEMSIVLDRATSPQGDGRLVICRPADDGEFFIGAAELSSLGARPGLPFGISAGRATMSPFCNEGVPSGVATHALIFLGRAVLQ